MKTDKKALQLEGCGEKFKKTAIPDKIKCEYLVPNTYIFPT